MIILSDLLREYMFPSNVLLAAIEMSGEPSVVRWIDRSQGLRRSTDAIGS